MTRHGVQYSHAHQNRVHERPTLREAILTAQAAVAAQPGIEYELMHDHGDGWRSDSTDETPEQVVARRWTW